VRQSYTLLVEEGLAVICLRALELLGSPAASGDKSQPPSPEVARGAIGTSLRRFKSGA
jgi:hypothetical protein